MKINKTLGEFIVDQQNKTPGATGELSSIFSSLKLAAKIVHREINKAGLVDISGASGEENIQGEQQQKLDVFANERFKTALAARGVVCGLASEEEDEFVIFEEEKNLKGNYVVLIDPLDGSSNIDVNVSVGTIFSVYHRVTPSGEHISEDDFLQPGSEQVAAGYIIYGSSTMLVYTSGHGVNGFTYDPSLGVFCLSHPDMKFPNDGFIYSINDGYRSHFSEPVKKYIAYCQTEDSASSRPYTARYIGSLVSDIHRNLIKGGIYLYPSSSKYPEGKLRLLYECNPIAMLVEQAGGCAIADNGLRILELKPSSLHERCPFYAGSKNMVAILAGFFE